MDKYKQMRIDHEKEIQKQLAPFVNLNERDNGVTIDYSFLYILAHPGRQITSSHIVFFLNLLKKYFSSYQKILVADLYFFVEYMPSLTIQLQSKMIQNSGLNELIANSINQPKKEQVQEQKLEIEKKPTYIPDKPASIFDRYYLKQEKDEKNELIQQNGEQIKVQSAKNLDIQQPIIQQVQPQQIVQNPDLISKGVVKQNLNQSFDESNQKKGNPQEGKQKQFQFQITNITVTKAEEGKYKIQKMQSMIDEYSKTNKLDPTVNPIYQTEFSFFPINLKNDHWISIIISPKTQIICLQDSAMRQNPEILDGVKQILDYKKPLQDIQWKCLARTPQQRGTQDCGIFVIYALYYLYTRGKLMDDKSYDQSFISIVRRNLVNLTLLEVSKQKNITPQIIQNMIEQK